MPTDPEDWQRTRRTLLSALKKTDNPALWEEFVDLYGPMITDWVREGQVPPTDAEDVIQETLLAIWKQIRVRGFTYDPAKGSFRGFVRNTTRWRIQDFFRKRMRELEREPERRRKLSSSTATIDRIPDPSSADKEIDSDTEWKQRVFLAAMERVKRQVKPKSFQIYDAYVLKEWPVEKLVKTLGASRTQVYLAKFRISKLIQKEVRQIETKGL